MSAEELQELEERRLQEWLALFPGRPAPCGRAGRPGLCETSFAWRLLLRDVWPRCGHQPYSPTSEEA